MPSVLYHGSMYLTDVLEPGFNHTHQEIKWDKNESNKFLYATTDEDMAISLGLASAIEKNCLLDRFSYKENILEIFLCNKKSEFGLLNLANLSVYLYIIDVKNEDGWKKNNNQNNHIDTEYKTSESVEHIQSVRKVDILAWLKSKRVIFHYKPSFSSW